MDDVFSYLGQLADDGERRAFLAGYVRPLDESARESFLERLKTESGRYLYIDLAVSLRLADALLCAADLAGRDDHRAMGLMALGDARRVQGLYFEARTLLDEAASKFQSLGDEVGWARTRIGWLDACLFLGEGAEALGVVDLAQGAFARHDEWPRAGSLNLNAGNVCLELGRHDEALGFFDRAIQFYQMDDQTPERQQLAEIRTAKAKTNKALILTLRGEFDLALGLFEEVRAVWITYGEAITIVRHDQFVADVYAGQGQHTRALRMYGEVFVELQRRGLPVDAWRVSLSMVECYLGLNQVARAVAQGEETVAKFDDLGALTDAARARFLTALASARAGDHDGARSRLEEAASAFNRTGFVALLGMSRLELARLHLTDGDWPNALVLAVQAGDQFFEQGTVIRLAEARLVQAWALLALDRLVEARDLAESALTTARTLGVPILAYEAHHLVGRLNERELNSDGALSAYGLAIASIEHMQSRLATDLRPNFLDDKVSLFHDAISLCLRGNRPEQAFQFLERAKSRSLLDYLLDLPEDRSRPNDATSQPLVDDLVRLRDEHHWLYQRLYGLQVAHWADDEAPPHPSIRDRTATEDKLLRAALADRERQIGRVYDRLILRRSVDQAAPTSDYFGSSGRRPSLDGDTVLLEYYLSSADGTVFVLTSDDIVAVPLDSRPADVALRVNEWRALLDRTARAVVNGTAIADGEDDATVVLTDLYHVLIEPIEPFLVGYEKLIVIPYGPVHGIPFHALFDGERYLVERFALSICPSSGLLDLARRRARRSDLSALVLANSDDGALPEVVAEARQVTELFPGECYVEEQATRKVLADRAGSHRVIHLAAHGEARPDNPVLAYLKLADGPLHALDTFGLDLEGALVTLSSCETGRSVVTGGDELLGLSRGFLHAGASTIVQSLWRVEDRSTERFMVEFYRGLGQGKPKGVAFRNAQLALIDNEFRHPYFWAAFEIVGDTGPL